MKTGELQQLFSTLYQTGLALPPRHRTTTGARATDGEQQKALVSLCVWRCGVHRCAALVRSWVEPGSKQFHKRQKTSEETSRR